MTGIIGAMTSETEKIVGMMTEISKETVSGLEFTKGKIHGKDAVVATCGVGKVYAAMCVEAMILKYKPDEIINTGVGGALVGGLSVCDVLIAESVCQHDMDTSPLGDPRGEISGIKVTFFECDNKMRLSLALAAKRAEIEPKSGIVASGDAFIADKEKKAEIVSLFGASLCEMEGGAIGHVCYVNSVPFCVLRAVSDSADDDSPVDFPAFCVAASDNNAKIISEYFKGA